MCLSQFGNSIAIWAPQQVVLDGSSVIGADTSSSVALKCHGRGGEYINFVNNKGKNKGGVTRLYWIDYLRFLACSAVVFTLPRLYRFFVSLSGTNASDGSISD